ncbi:MAG: ATP-binding protein [Myxococcota bacterium]
MEGEEPELNEEAVGSLGTRSLLLLAALSLFAVMAWALIEGSERRAHLRQNELTATQAAFRLHEHMEARFSGTRVLAAELSARPPRTAEDFDHRARALMEAFGGFHAVMLIERGSVLRYGLSQRGPMPTGLQLVGGDDDPTLRQALTEGVELLSEPVAAHEEGNLHLSFYVPLRGPGGRARGVVASVMDLEEMLEGGLSEGLLEAHSVVLRDGEREVYRSAGFEGDTLGMGTFEVGGREWQLELSPSAALLDHLKSHRHDFALLVALAFITVMVFLMRARVRDRRRGEQLALDRARLATLVETSPELQALTDREGRILYVNRAGRAWLGGDIGPKLTERFAPEERDQVNEGLASALQGDLFRGDLHLHGPDGPRPCVAQARALAGVDCVAWVIRDRTEEYRLQRELEQAQKLEALGRLAGGVAHDFNNLLTALLGHAMLARDELPEGSAARADLEHVVAGARRGAELTRNLLAFSRQRVTETRILDVSDELRRIERLLKHLVRENVRFEPQLLAARAWVRMAPSQLEQMVMNLVVNAVDAMPEGGTLRVVLEVGEDDVRVTVSDDGIGMTEEVKARAFEPFFTTKREAGGTGLGLASVYGTVRQLGGTVVLDSTPGQGTRIELRLPRSTEAPLREDVTKTARGIPPLRVLLVEDEDGVRRTAARLLRREGHEVTQAVDGVEALERWEADGPFELLMTDVVMPRLGGLDLVKKLRDGGARTPVILCSGYADELRDTGTVDDLGARFLEKPYDLGTLREALQEASEQNKEIASEPPSAVAGAPTL